MLDRFYPIVDSVDWVKRLLDLGVETIQLRLKEDGDIEYSQICHEIREAINFARKYSDTTLIINDYWQEAIEFGASFIHLGQEDIQKAGQDGMKLIKDSGLGIGISTHSDQELVNALVHAPDYIALGPIYKTTLKKMPWQPQGLEKIGYWKQQIDCPLVAIGGITLELADDIFAVGADSIAVVTDIIYNDNPEQRVKDWLAKV